MQKLIGQLRRCVEDYHMISEGDRIAVGVSGGKDSLTLLVLLAELRKYYPKRFELEALTVDMGLDGMDFSPVAALCAQLDVPYTCKHTQIGPIIFDYRKEKNPCSMCAKMRRGALNDLIAEHGFNKVALGHHFDDAAETFLMSLLYEGRIGCFEPVTYLSRTGITQIRPMLYVGEQAIAHFAERYELPVVHNVCPADKHTKRQEVKELIAAGYKDITLLGQNVNSYGKDLGLGVDFADLLGELAELPGEFWLRFMTSHPKDATKKLFDTIASHEKIAKQFHLPFQSGNDRVLKVMNRHYDSAQYLALVDYGRSLMPGLVLTSDVIVGFPGETEEEFEDTIRLIERVRYDALFTFIFSPRPGTPAAKMDDPTPKEEKNRRFDRLCEVQNRISQEIHQAYVGRTMRVLVDGKDGELLTARTEGGRLVRMTGPDCLLGQFAEAKITGCTTWSLTGESVL